MRVLLVGDHPPPYGGVAIHVRQLLQYLRGRELEVKVLDIGKGGRPAPDVIPVHGPAHFGLRLAGFVAGGWTLHLHTSGNNPKSWALAGMVGGLPGGRAPRVITLHSGLLPDYLRGSSARRVLAGMALAGYARVVAVSGAVRDAVVACGVPAHKVLVHPAFCASQVTAGAVPPRVESARARRRPLLVMAHHPSPVYGRRLAFQALRRLVEELPDVGLAVFGPGTRSEEFRRDVRETRVAAYLEDLGELEHDAALGLLSRADAFLRPTTHDGDSISVREALALGVPCVASDVCPRPVGTRVFQADSARDLAFRVREALAAGPPRVVSPDAGPVLEALYAELALARAERARAAPAV
ncbi:glycosyl transferase family 1 [Corallococcus sp. H22C18031201]|uniref:glycosyltransferase family 4 protein n=1 Tax=Citreicoccus inhibens TaxID=2849499 RepID=UPI000E73454D|nr:glycosyltransferase family 4 protein [Citreicoccus inhibens]MBU8900183.1 glycosyltransferase family 4 protein [Citreicoccus inhibens]RJS16351.1 glycosyl transferase family 1 [Corallococcus sp. H22C18031201]